MNAPQSHAAHLDSLLKLNLGCGMNPLEGYLNVDKHLPKWATKANDDEGLPLGVKFISDAGVQFRLMDLENPVWPWPAECVGKVVLNHVLEHVGRDPEVFCQIMKNLYHVCAPAARIHIAVPHPRHDDFLNDPTHVRVVTPEVLGLFSMKNCLEWTLKGAANSPLAMYHGVDFELDEVRQVIEEPHWGEFQSKAIPATELQRRVRSMNNVVKEVRMVLRVVKPSRTEAEGAA